MRGDVQSYKLMGALIVCFAGAVAPADRDWPSRAHPVVRGARICICNQGGLSCCDIRQNDRNQE